MAGILAHYGYIADAGAQSAETVNGIRLAISVYASIPFLLCVARLFFYEIDKSMETWIEQDLDERRAGTEPAP